MPTPNLDRIREIQGEALSNERAIASHLRDTLQIIADFPITDRAANQDAANMALIASQALRATARPTS
jgi:hypothetical protein